MNERVQAPMKRKQRIRQPESISSQVYAMVLAQIQGGELAAETKLVDIAIAKELEVSRMPVREAMLRLVAEGYLVSTSRGFTLVRLTRKEIAEAFEVRKLLEPTAAAMVARAIPDEWTGRLQQYHEAYEAARQAQDRSGMGRALIQFRQGWTGQVPNRRLADMLARFADHTQIIRSIATDNPDSQERSSRYLRRMIEAFRASDERAAHDAVQMLLVRAEEKFIDNPEIYGCD